MWRFLTSLLIPALLLGLLGCGEPADATRGPFLQVIGSKGYVSGRFDRPRGIRYEPETELLHVLDWSGRIQMFTRDGVFRSSWKMPLTDKGKAEDFIILPNGNYMIVDTHYSRVVEFTRAGEEVWHFGSYGRDEGQFIYPVGIARDRDGYLYISEYGENDRIQKFTADGQFVKAWGSFGSEPGQFQRPSGICISHNDRLFVADGINHRIQVFDLDGKLLQIIGAQGKGLGQFSYPYDVGTRGDTLYVLEYGNQRVQRLTTSGEPEALFAGSTDPDGFMASPWRFDVGPETVWISDTQNNRVLQVGF